MPTKKGKGNLNFNMPEPLKAEFDAVARRYGSREKWKVCGAAVVLLLELEDTIQDEYIGEVGGSESSSERVKRLIASAKSGRLRRSIEDRLLPEFQRLVSEPIARPQRVEQSAIKTHKSG